MTNGKKNYFRHSFKARNDDFICELINEFGVSGYYYYFALIEMCAEKVDDSQHDTCKFFKRNLIQGLRLSTRKLNQFLDYLELKSKVSYTLVDSTYEIKVHNLLKYFGSYRKNDAKKPPKVKESKGKEIKINKNKNINTKKNLKSETDNLIAQVVDYLNLQTGKKYRKNSKHCKLIADRAAESDYTLQDFKTAIDNQIVAWGDDVKMKKYIQPSTLFGNKFDQYLNNLPADKSELKSNDLLPEINNFFDGKSETDENPWM